MIFLAFGFIRSLLKDSAHLEFKGGLLGPEERGWDFVSVHGSVLRSLRFSSCRSAVDRMPSSRQRLEALLLVWLLLVHPIFSVFKLVQPSGA